MTNELFRLRNAASVMSGNRPLQSWPLRVNRRTLALALDDQAKPVMFYFVQPVRAGGNLGTARRDAGFERRFTHTAKIGSR